VSEHIKNAVIQQLNIGYNAPEDRLLLKIGMSEDAELVVWLTRRISRTLWQLLQDDQLLAGVAPDVHSPQAKQLLESFAKESAAQQLDFSEEYKVRHAVNADELFLAQDCHLVKSGNGAPVLELACTNGQTLKVVLNQDLSLALSNMLQMVAKEAAWDITFSGQPSLLNSVTANTVLH
jgi:hypothetical protein